MKRKVISYIAESLDGFITIENGTISWLAMVEQPHEDYGMENLVRKLKNEDWKNIFIDGGSEVIKELRNKKPD